MRRWPLFALHLAFSGTIAAANYNTWHAIDEQMVVCPLLPPPKELPQGMTKAQWPTKQEYEVAIDATEKNGVNVKKSHIITFMRQGKTQAVSLTYSVADADGQVILDSQTVTLQGSGDRLTDAEKCKCTGDNGRLSKAPELIKRFGKSNDVGKYCKAWDATLCDQHYPDDKKGSWCCKAWCYVGPECPDAYMAHINHGAYWSFGACEGDNIPQSQRSVTTKAQCKYIDMKAGAKPCDCVDVDKTPQWSQLNITKLGAGYGNKCKAWDMENCADPQIYGPEWLDTWCCEDWCWTGSQCETAIPSKIWKGLYWTTAACPDDPAKTSQCPFKAYIQPSAQVAQICECLGWSPSVLHSGRRRQPGGISRPADYGSVCKAWEKDNCDKLWPKTKAGAWCCQSWCYVDKDCPTANPSMVADGYFWSQKACEDDGPTLRMCKYSEACYDSKAKPAGLTEKWPKLKAPLIPSTYGKGCKAHDEANCETWWKGTSYWDAKNNDWCCHSWSYIEETCPIGEEGALGSSYSYSICRDSPNWQNNWRTYDPVSKTCKAGTTTTTTVTTTKAADAGRRRQGGRLLQFMARTDEAPERVLTDMPKYLQGKVHKGKKDEKTDKSDAQALTPAALAVMIEHFDTNSDGRIDLRDAAKAGAEENEVDIESSKDKDCDGTAYTNDKHGKKSGCNGWFGITADQCKEKCETNAQAMFCPKKQCAAAVFFPDPQLDKDKKDKKDHDSKDKDKKVVGWCHLYDADNCKKVKDQWGHPTLFKKESERRLKGKEALLAPQLAKLITHFDVNGDGKIDLMDAKAHGSTNWKEFTSKLSGVEAAPKFETIKDEVCTGQAYTNIKHGKKNGCNGFGGIDAKTCQHKCATNARAPFCPRKHCAASVFFPSGKDKGWCHLFTKEECKKTQPDWGKPLTFRKADFRRLGGEASDEEQDLDGEEDQVELDAGDEADEDEAEDRELEEEEHEEGEEDRELREEEHEQDGEDAEDEDGEEHQQDDEEHQEGGEDAEDELDDEDEAPERQLEVDHKVFSSYWAEKHEEEDGEERPENDHEDEEEDRKLQEEEHKEGGEAEDHEEDGEEPREEEHEDEEEDRKLQEGEHKEDDEGADQEDDDEDGEKLQEEEHEEGGDDVEDEPEDDEASARQLKDEKDKGKKDDDDDAEALVPAALAELIHKFDANKDGKIDLQDAGKGGGAPKVEMETFKDKNCDGTAYTNVDHGKKNGCNGWFGITAKECEEKCAEDAKAPFCPKKKCAAAVFFLDPTKKDKHGGWCHLYEADQCKKIKDDWGHPITFKKDDMRLLKDEGKDEKDKKDEDAEGGVPAPALAQLITHFDVNGDGVIDLQDEKKDGHKDWKDFVAKLDLTGQEAPKFEKTKDQVCKGHAYTNVDHGKKNGCNGFGGINAEACQHLCAINARAPFCPRKHCAASVFFGNGKEKGWCHLFTAKECEETKPDWGHPITFKKAVIRRLNILGLKANETMLHDEQELEGDEDVVDFHIEAADEDEETDDENEEGSEDDEGMDEDDGEKPDGEDEDEEHPDDKEGDDEANTEEDGKEEEGEAEEAEGQEDDDEVDESAEGDEAASEEDDEGENDAKEDEGEGEHEDEGEGSDPAEESSGEQDDEAEEDSEGDELEEQSQEEVEGQRGAEEGAVVRRLRSRRRSSRYSRPAPVARRRQPVYNPRRRTPSTPRRRLPSPRRRQTYANQARRRQPSRVSAPGRRRQPAVSSASYRRRQAPAPSPSIRRRQPPAPPPSSTNYGGRRRQTPPRRRAGSSASSLRRRQATPGQASADTGRRRQNPSSLRRREAAGRRRQVGIGGRVYSTGRRRQSPPRRRAAQPRRRQAAVTPSVRRRQAPPRRRASPGVTRRRQAPPRRRTTPTPRRRQAASTSTPRRRQEPPRRRDVRRRQAPPRRRASAGVTRRRQAPPRRRAPRRRQAPPRRRAPRRRQAPPRRRASPGVTRRRQAPPRRRDVRRRQAPPRRRASPGVTRRRQAPPRRRTTPDSTPRRRDVRRRQQPPRRRDVRRRQAPPRRRDVKGVTRRRQNPPRRRVTPRRRQAPTPPRRRFSDQMRRRGTMSMPRRRTTRRRQPYGYADGRRRDGDGRRRYEARRRQPYGYTTHSQLQYNYGGHDPHKADYGYSGKAQNSGSTATIAMAAAAGVVGGAMLGVGGYYAYNRYKEQQAYNSQHSGSRPYQGTSYQDIEWCRIPPGQYNAGGMMECRDCIKQFGPQCKNQNSCFQNGGCNYKLQKDVYRDDLMGTGFVPEGYKSPITITIEEILGSEFQSKDICPSTTDGKTGNNWIKASSFQTNLFVTLTEMDNLGSPDADTPADTQGFVPARRRGATTGYCQLDTHGSCTSNAGCYTKEICVNGACQCETGYCYSKSTFSCVKRGVASAAPLQASASWTLLAALLFFRYIRRLF